MDKITDYFEAMPSVSEQVKMYRAGNYDDLRAGPERDAMSLPLDTPAWQVRLLFLGQAEANRVCTVCKCISEADEETSLALIGTLRASLMTRDGQKKLSNQPPSKSRPATTRLAIFFMVEKFRLAGLSRDEAIDCVARMTRNSPSSKTITAWYDKKHGPEYTGLKRLAQMMVARPEETVGPIIVEFMKMITRNVGVVIMLHKCLVIADAERAKIKPCAKWLHQLGTMCSRQFCDKDADLDYKSTRKRVDNLDRVKIFDSALPVLLK